MDASSFQMFIQHGDNRCNRNIFIVEMQHIQVDIISSQAFERVFNIAGDVFRRDAIAAIVGMCAFIEDDNLVS